MPPPIAPPRRPRRRKWRWNWPEMNESAAPTKCSTSMISLAPAMAPRVAKATASSIATRTSTKTTIPIATVACAIVARRASQTPWSSRLAPGTLSSRASRSATLSTRAPGVQLDDDEARHRQVGKVEPGAKPGLQQLLAVRLGIRVDRSNAGRALCDVGGLARRRVEVAAVGGAHLDRHLARDIALPVRRGIGGEHRNASGERGEEGHDRDNRDERANGDRVGRHQRHVALQRPVVGELRLGAGRRAGQRDHERLLIRICAGGFRRAPGAARRRTGPSGRGRA